MIPFVNVDAIGRYQILGEIGKGGMGVVYRALDSALKRTVAIKTVRLPEGAPTDARDSLERLIREAQAAAMLTHPHIVTVHDLIEQNGMLYIVMEFVEGESLSALLDSGRQLSRPDAFRILRETAEALDYAHSRGVVHRDVKPANILLQRGGSSKITDFGIAKLSEPQGDARKLTAAGTIIGTLEYMAPEQIRGEEVDGRADQYSLAVIAYQLLGGALPFVAPSIIALAHRIVSEVPKLLPGGTSAEQAVLSKALAKDPGARFENCRAMVQSLAAQVAPMPIAAPSSAKRSYAIAAVAVVLLAGFASAAYFLLNAKKVPPDVPAIQTELKRPSEPPTAVKAPIAPPVVTQPVGADKTDSKRPPIAPTEPVGIVKQPPPVIPEVHDTSAGAGRTRKNPVDGQTYVWIPAGTFQMGCTSNDPNCRREENPAHKVTLTKGFWLGQTETSTGAYKRFASATGRSLPKPLAFNRDWEIVEQPMVKVSWLDSNAYCEWAGGRLPSEAEWEYAARAGNPPAIYITGNSISHDDANFGSEESEEKGAAEGRDQWIYTAPIASFAANRFKLFDMTGNAGEWVNDWFSEDYYLTAPAKDPPGPGQGSLRVIRGGSWMSKKTYLRLSYRIGREPEHISYSFGFRCAADK